MEKDKVLVDTVKTKKSFQRLTVFVVIVAAAMILLAQSEWLKGVFSQEGYEIVDAKFLYKEFESSGRSGSYTSYFQYTLDGIERKGKMDTDLRDSSSFPKQLGVLPSGELVRLTPVLPDYLRLLYIGVMIFFAYVIGKNAKKYKKLANEPETRYVFQEVAARTEEQIKMESRKEIWDRIFCVFLVVFCAIFVGVLVKMYMGTADVQQHRFYLNLNP